MDVTTVTSAPAAGDFIPLEEHQAETPATFYGSKPVLHYQMSGASVNIPQTALSSFEQFAALNSGGASGSTTAVNGDAQNGTAAGPETTIEGLDVWVTSESLLLWSPAASKGVSIPYPTIALHALQRLSDTPAASQGVYLSLHTIDLNQADASEDIETLDFTLLPAAAAGAATPSAAESLFAALSACADLHPDPSPDDDAGPSLLGGGFGGLGGAGGPPGEGGWITSENMADFVDAEGNFVGFGGAGGAAVVAGTVREREDEAEEDEQDAGEGAEEGGARTESKWRRTD